MRFATKYDRWVVAGVAAAPVVAGIAWIRMLVGIANQREPAWIAGGAMLVWLCAMASCWPQYYEVRGDSLFIRQGWRRITIPYAELTAVVASSDAHSAGVFSVDRVLIETSPGNRYIIAPADQAGFFEAIAARAPQLERSAGGLRVALGGLAGI